MLFAVVSDEQVKKNRIILGVFVAACVCVIGAVVLWRKQIWDKLPASIKKQLVYLYSLFMWNGIIRLMLEMFYPNVLLSLMTV